MEQKYFYALLIFPLVLALRVAAHFVDKRRIKDEVEARIGRVVSIVWNPFGRGWFFEKGERHYDVTYVDRHSGGTVTAACKTSMFTGVYWADGETAAETPPAHPVAAPLCEMRLLDSGRMARLPKLREGDGSCMIHTVDSGFTRLQNSLHNYQNKLIGPLLLLGVFLSSMGCAVSSRPSDGDKLTLPRQVFLVRHSEREWEGEDPPLVAGGEARAQALAETLRDAGITRIVTTQWRRTRDTAQPLANLLKITPQVIPVFEGKVRENVEEVAAAVRGHKGETVLIVGHITVTGVIAALGGPRLPTICDNVFSDLFLFTPAAGDAGLLHFHYGAAEEISPRCRISRPMD